MRKTLDAWLGFYGRDVPASQLEYLGCGVSDELRAPPEVAVECEPQRDDIDGPPSPRRPLDATQLRREIEEMENQQTVMLPIGAFVESPRNPRQRYSNMEEFTETVRKHGILTALVVRPIGKNGRLRRDSYEILAGHRRFRAAQQVGLTELPATVRELDDEAALEIMLLENLHREDVHPIEEAEGYQRLIDEHGFDVDKIAERVSKSVSYIYQRLKLAALIPAAKKAFLGDEITASHAILIARESAANQKAALKYATDPHHAPSVRAFEEWIHEEFYGLDLSGAPWKKDDAELVPKAGPCAACPKRTGANPELYPELKKGKDICQDEKCYARKLDTFTRQAVAADPEAVPVALGYHQPQELKALKRDYPKLVSIDHWQIAKKKTPGAKRGIQVDDVGYYGSNAPGKGRTLYFKTERAESVREDASMKRWKAEQKRRAQAREAKTYARQKLAAALVEKVPAVPAERELRLVAKGFFADVWFERQKALAQRHGVEAKGNRQRLDKLMAERIDHWSAAELTPFLVECAVARDLDVGYNDRSEPDLLTAAATAYGLKPQVILRGAEAECRRLQKAKASKKKPKAKAKAAAKKAPRKTTAVGNLVHKLHTGGKLGPEELKKLQTEGSPQVRARRNKAKGATA